MKELEQLRRELAETRKASLEATRKGEFMRVAHLTARAAALNKKIMEKESLLRSSI